MTSEVRLIVGAKDARLVLTTDGTAVEDELWSFDRRLSATEAKELARVVFDDAYDMLNNLVHGSE